MKKAFLSLLTVCLGMTLVLLGSCSNSGGDSLSFGEGKSDMNWQYAYDEQGRIKELTGPGKRTVVFSYQEQAKTGLIRRVTRQDADGNKVDYDYDEFGRLEKMSDAAGVVAYAYDEENRLNGVQREGGPKIAYDYDSSHRLKTLRVGDKGHLKLDYTYDFLGRPAAIATPKGDITYEYQTGANRIVRTLPNGIGTVYDYQPNGRLKEIIHVDSGRRILCKYAYAYRPDGLIEQIIEWTPKGERTIDYAYDEVQRLIAVADSRAGKTEYRYDKLGNRLAIQINNRESDVAKFDWAGRIVERSAKACRHDAAHNLTDCEGAAVPKFAFDVLNAIKTVNSGGGTIEYRHDGDGYLLSRTHAGKQTRYLPDPASDVWRPLLASTPDGKETFYIWAGDTPLMAVSGSDVQYMLTDHLGSVRAIADQGGKVVEHFDYSPFGVPAQALAAGALQPGFAGLFYDPAASVYLTKARAYDPHTGRFLQIDPQLRIPTGSQKDFSPYVYCGNDPVNFVDRNGAEARAVVSEFEIKSITNQVTELMKYLHREDVIWAKRDIQLGTQEEDGQIKHYYKCWEYQRIIYEMLLSNDDINRDWLVIPYAQDEKKDGVRWTHFFNVIQYKQNPEIQFKIDTWSKFNLRGWLFPSDSSKLEPWPGNRSTEDLKYFKAYQFGYPYWEKKSRKEILKEQKDRNVPLPLFTSSISAKTLFNHVTNSGNIISGTFKKETQRYYLNGEMARRTVRHTRYTETRDGRALSAAVERWDKTGIWEYPAKISQDINASQKHDRALYQKKIEEGRKESSDKTGKRRRNDDMLPSSISSASSSGSSSGGPGTGSSGGSGSSSSSGFFGSSGSGFLGSSSSSGGVSAMDRSRQSAHMPSNVGGVYLRGAGEALKNMGTISGVTVDENGRMILIAEGSPAIGLPPMRLDDIVTVFKSVYEHGSPFVSIDPNPKDPEGPIMLVRHDEGTKETYAGWVLFEADRVMKAYSLGYDNVTKEKLSSNVTGYQNMFDMGFSNAAEGKQEQIWERFWIVPAEVKRHQSANNKLSIYDVPLKVNTQRMALKNGKLEPADGKASSPAARTFSDWFTKSYDQIAAESRSNPVSGSGMEGPVAVFTELRRIALLTAIAENLRDSGVALPAWMENYAVKPYPVPKTTPSITVEASQTETKKTLKGSAVETVKSTRTQRIYGGVRLAPEDRDIHVVKASPQAEKLIVEVKNKMASVPSLTPVAIRANGKTYQAVALPGEKTSVLGGNQLQETDLVVPVLRGTTISLTREFNSFFQPQEAWGQGWTLNLPQLKQARQPVERIGDETRFQTRYSLTSPLGSYAETFREIRFVPEVNAKIMVPQNSGAILGLAQTTKKEIGAQTTEIIFRDGSEWHFDGDGYLAATVDGPAMVIYRWNKDHRLTRIEGWYGKNLLADIRLEYDSKGRMISAKGSNKDEVGYAYDAAGQLQDIKWKEGKLAYGYDRGLVTSIKVEGKEVRGYAYDAQGRLIEERFPQEIKRNYAYEGQKVTAIHNKTEETSEYDSTMRPVKRRFADGTLVQWQYPKQDTVIASVTPSGSNTYQVVSKENGRYVEWLSPDGQSMSADYDAAHRMTALRKGNRTLMQQQWHSNGLPGDTLYETYAMRPRYREDNVASGMLITPPGNQKKFSEWVEVDYNELGYPAAIRDFGGAEAIIAYGKDGQPQAIKSRRGGVEMTYDGTGRVEGIKTSWGQGLHYVYDDKTGAVKKMVSMEDSKKAVVEFDDGNPVLLEQFDGGKYKMKYEKSDGATLLKEVSAPNGVKLVYRYNANGRIENIDCDKAYAVKFAYDDKGRLTGLSQAPLR